MRSGRFAPRPVEARVRHHTHEPEPYLVKLRTALLLLVSHGIAAAVGFAGGIYALPILIAPAAPSAAEVSAVAADATYSAEFRRDLEDSDAFHWGEGKVSIGKGGISFMGKLAPGPDYKLYLSPEFVETEVDFNRLKPQMALVGDVKTFTNFLVDVPPGVDPSQYTSIIVWCETFGEFITSAKYKSLRQ